LAKEQVIAERVRGSFRDPSGFVFVADGTFYRQVNRSFSDEYDACVSSGLYDDLIQKRLLVAHRDVGIGFAATPDAHAVIEPTPVPFISYPYEWSFGQLRDAALLTLDVQERALDRGFVLRDASAYNVQLVDGGPLFIDTLSFERYHDGAPWAGYKQFCEHFLVPLALMSVRDPRCGRLQREYLDGIPLDLGSALLPRGSWLRPSLLLHVHVHARAMRRYESASVAEVTGGRRLGKKALLRLVASLRDAVLGLEWRPEGTAWSRYTSDHGYSEQALESKRRLVREYVSAATPRTVWDLGGNTGTFSRIAREVAELVVCFDADPAAVESNYREVRARKETGLLPLQMDLMNPSPENGWAHEERLSLESRGPADLVMALALVHHLAIANNVPLPTLAAWLARLGRSLLIEFVPKSDSQVARLLTNRADIFPRYTPEELERAFEPGWRIEAKQRIDDSQRMLYLMRRRQG
ncbi:MAG TPA: class I SAM-dependent methyltransferase, partial [Gemmatimonadaceae bacterium]|nr:class I SAM-dependent methyltransferase [Gemmatimonadaceae bacterium]